MELDPITVAALEVLNLKPDRLPTGHGFLADLVAERNPPEAWTWDHTAAYRHLRSVVPRTRQPSAKPKRAPVQSAA